MNASKITRAATAWLALITLVVGCARTGADAEIQTGAMTPAPAMPAPISQPPESQSTPGSIGMAELPNQLPQQMSQCASHWDLSSLWSQLQSSFYYGSYDPYDIQVDPFYYPYPRGLKSKSSRGLGCMNSLMQMGSMLHGYDDYFEPGALQGYLQKLLRWSYGNPYRYGGGDSLPL
jgi:hypothetical protein